MKLMFLQKKSITFIVLEVRTFEGHNLRKSELEDQDYI